jgi:hypothetical protein
VVLVAHLPLGIDTGRPADDQRDAGASGVAVPLVVQSTMQLSSRNPVLDRPRRGVKPLAGGGRLGVGQDWATRCCCHFELHCARSDPARQRGEQSDLRMYVPLASVMMF